MSHMFAYVSRIFGTGFRSQGTPRYDYQGDRKTAPIAKRGRQLSDAGTCSLTPTAASDDSIATERQLEG